MWLVLFTCQNQKYTQICAGLGFVIVSLVHARRKLHIWAAGGGAGDSYKSERLHTHRVDSRDGKAAVVLPTTSLPSRSQGD